MFLIAKSVGVTHAQMRQLVHCSASDPLLGHCSIAPGALLACAPGVHALAKRRPLQLTHSLLLLVLCTGAANVPAGTCAAYAGAQADDFSSRARARPRTLLSFPVCLQACRPSHGGCMRRGAVPSSMHSFIYQIPKWAS